MCLLKPCRIMRKKLSKIDEWIVHVNAVDVCTICACLNTFRSLEHNLPFVAFLCRWGEHFSFTSIDTDFDLRLWAPLYMKYLKPFLAQILAKIWLWMELLLMLNFCLHLIRNQRLNIIYYWKSFIKLVVCGNGIKSSKEATTKKWKQQRWLLAARDKCLSIDWVIKIVKSLRHFI